MLSYNRYGDGMVELQAIELIKVNHISSYLFVINPEINHNETILKPLYELPTMTSITIKNIPEGLYQNLKTAAAINRRSINSELIVCLEKTLSPCKISAEERILEARGIRNRLEKMAVTAEDIHNAKQDGRR